MFSHALIVARKEIRDHLRDTRSLVSSAFYALMGPLVVGMVSIAVHGAVHGEKSSAVLLSMASVFALVATFVAGMNVAMDAIAGERERRSLLPLLMNPLLRRDVVLGKWLAISLFAVAGVVINLAGFAIVVGLPFHLLIAVTLALIPLVLFASAVELLISTWSRNIKEAHTYLSLVIFLPMVIGMFFGILSAHGFDVALATRGRSAIADRSADQRRAIFAGFNTGAEHDHHSLRGARLAGQRKTFASR